MKYKIIKLSTFILLASFFFTLSACSTQTVRIVDMTPPKQLAQSLPEDELLDIGISVFSANVPDNYDDRIEQIISPEIRRAEAQYIPYIAKNLIQSSGNWGAVRVIPRPSLAVDVILSGEIIELVVLGDEVQIAMTVEGVEGTLSFSVAVPVAERNALAKGVPVSVSLIAEGIHLMAAEQSM